MFKSDFLKIFSIYSVITFTLLSLSTLSHAGNIPAYDRGLFGSWKDFDNDCQNTRHELLQTLSLRRIHTNG